MWPLSKKVLSASLLATAGLLVAGNVSFAGRPDTEPQVAKQLISSLVKGYQPCLSPNEGLNKPFAWPGCTPPVEEDSLCGFGKRGRGLMKLIILGGCIPPRAAAFVS